MRFWQKAAFPLATLPIWFASSYATWGMWYIFTMINAFHLVVYLKGQNMAFLVEHEVQAAYSTFCNMVMSSTPALVSVLIPRAFDKHYLESPDPLFGFVFLLIFFVTFWTDVLADGIKKLPEKIHTWHLSKRRQRSTTGTDSRETA
ncbi:hypothetical protein B0O99DRAFT_629335 [Bisporella sp. PMI_857]|nr:hypothetical protein B0O99DRAFT_629335 [Bisporella sp. PMI_857]